MKKVGTKILIILMVIVMLSLFVLPNFQVFAVTTETEMEPPRKIGEILSTALGGLPGLAGWLVRLVFVSAGLVINVATSAFATIGGLESREILITPSSIFFNEIPLLNVNIFDMTTGGANSAMVKVHETIAVWYYVLRLLATAILLVMLIYTGIRMALASSATDKAVYKKMLLDWIASVVIMYLMHYFMIFIFAFNNALVGVIKSAAYSSETISTQAGSQVSEYMIHMMNLALHYSSMGGSQGLQNNTLSFMSTIIFILLVYETIKFLFLYVKRMLTVSFLVMISPLITVTYSMDKMGDGKAQAFDGWIKEFLYNVLIQPFHCILYVAFADAAFRLVVVTEISSENIALSTSFGNGLLAILGILFINKGEEFIRKVFGFGKSGTLSTAAASAVTMAAVARNAPKLGTSMKKLSAITKKDPVNKAIKKLESKAGKAIKEGYKSAREGSSSNSKNVLNSAGRLAGHVANGAGKVGKTIGGFTNTQLRKMSEESNRKQAIKDYRKEHEYDRNYNENMTDDEIYEANIEDIDNRTKAIAAEGGAASHRKAKRDARTKKFLDKHPSIVADGNFIKNSAQAIAQSRPSKWVGLQTGRLKNWVKEGAIAEYENIKNGGVSRYIAPVAGVMTGLAALDSSGDVISGIVAGKAAVEGTQGYFKNSKATLNSENRKIMKRNALLSDNTVEARSDQEIAVYKANVFDKGANGFFDESALKSAETKLKNALMNTKRFSGQERQVTEFLESLKADMRSGKFTFSQAMNRNGGTNFIQDAAQNEAMVDDVQSYMISLNEAELYNNMHTSVEFGATKEDVTGLTKEMQSQIIAAAGVATMAGSVIGNSLNDNDKSEAYKSQLEAKAKELAENIRKEAEEAIDTDKEAAKKVSEQSQKTAEEIKRRARQYLEGKDQDNK